MFMVGLPLFTADCSRRAAMIRAVAAPAALYCRHRFDSAGKLKAYRKHTMKNILTTVGTVFVGSLILLGIGGIAYHLFREGGWFSQGLGVLWRAQYQAPVMTIILIAAAIFVGRALYTAQIGGTRGSKIPDLLLYVFIATGLFFLGRLILTGEI
jgi:hypothetical protein